MNLLSVVTDGAADARYVPIYKSTAGITFPDMYSLGPFSLPPGSAVLVTAQLEVTNPYAYNVGFGCRIIRSSPAGVITLLPAAMMNITPAEHHTVRSFAVWDLPNVPDPTYILEGYAAASRVVSGNKLVVEGGCGLMQCAVFAP